MYITLSVQCTCTCNRCLLEKLGVAQGDESQNFKFCGPSDDTVAMSKSNTIKQLASPGRCRGYSVTFVHQPPREVETECPICCDILFQPKVVTCCGVSFCAGCISLVERDGKPCPHCRGSFISYDDKKLRRTLNGYKVFCPHKEKGCKWIGELSQCDAHLDQSGLLAHSANRCLFHKIYCHLCQKKCERRLMPDHLSNDCPHRDVECRYHFVGCEFKRPLQEMEDHLRESIDSHLLLTAKSFVQIRNDLKNETKKQQKKQLAELNSLKELQESQLDLVNNMLEKQQARQLVEINELKRQQERQLAMELKLQERKLAEANKGQVDELVKQQQQQEMMQEQFTNLTRKHEQLERKNRIIAGCLVLTVIAFIIAGTMSQILNVKELPLSRSEIDLAILNRIKNMESQCGNAKTAVSSTNDHRDTMNNGRMEDSLDSQLLPTVTVYSDVLENIPSLTDTDVDVEADRNLESKNSVYNDLDSETAHADTKDTIPTNNHAKGDIDDLPAEDLLLSNPTAVVVNKATVEGINLRESHVDLDLELSDQLDYQINKVIHVVHVDLKNICSVKDYFVDCMLMGSSNRVCRVNDDDSYASEEAKFPQSKVMGFNSDMTVESRVCKARDIFINFVEWSLSPDGQKMDSDKVSHTDQVSFGAKPLVNDSKGKGIQAESDLHPKGPYPNETKTDTESRKMKRALTESDLNANNMKPSHIVKKTHDIVTVHASKTKGSSKVHSTIESQVLLEQLQSSKNLGGIILVFCACFCILAVLENHERRERSVAYRPHIRRRYKRIY